MSRRKTALWAIGIGAFWILFSLLCMKLGMVPS